MLQSLTRILHGSLVQTDTEMAKKYIYIHLYSPFLVEIRQTTTIGKFVFGRYGAGCVSALMGLVTLIFDLLTLKLICELH